MGITLAALNDLDQAAFTTAMGWIFEDSPWVAERAWSDRPFRSLDHLHRAMVRRVERAKREEQFALIRAHPDLATRAQISTASVREQAGAGLDQLSPEEHQRLIALNRVYTAKYGFPFIMAVRGQSKESIMRAMTQRVGGSPNVEFEVALREIAKIARFRLEETVSQ